MLLIILYHTDFLAGVLFSFLCADHFNPLNADLNPICHLLALLGSHHILHVSRIRVKLCASKHSQIQYTFNTGLHKSRATKRFRV